MSIAAHRKVRGLLEGEYGSVYKGRSMDFDDLREYVPSDDIKDIDWKATARSGQMLIKRYIAIKKHNFLLVVDTGRSMAATTPSGESKKDVGIMAAGMIASVAQQHGDLVGLVAGDEGHIKYVPLKDTSSHVERLLQYINLNTSIESPVSNLTSLLDYVRRNIRKRMMLIIISDNIQFADVEEQLLRRLGAQHELLFIAIDDLNPSDDAWNRQDVFDVESTVFLPTYIRSQKKITRLYQEAVAEKWTKANHLLERMGIMTVRIDSEDTVVGNIIRLLEKQKHAKK